LTLSTNHPSNIIVTEQEASSPFGWSYVGIGIACLFLLVAIFVFVTYRIKKRQTEAAEALELQHLRYKLSRTPDMPETMNPMLKLDLETSIKADEIPALYSEEASVSDLQNEKWFQNRQRPSAYDEPSVIPIAYDNAPPESKDFFSISYAPATVSRSNNSPQSVAFYSHTPLEPSSASESEGLPSSVSRSVG
jgi:hypothetical protein